MPEQLRKLVYVSRSRILLGETERELERVRESCLRNNDRDGITGSLLYAPGLFAQYVEGPREQLTQLAWRLRHDRRHEAINGFETAIEHRLFRNWSFGITGEASYMNRRLELMHAGAIGTAEEEQIVWIMQRYSEAEIQPGRRLPNVIS